MPIILIIALLVGGGVSVAAEQSLPGDALYPIKISLNESVRGGLSLSSEAKANYEVTKAEKRLVEAEELAAEGKLDTEAQAQIEANFDRFAERVAARIEEVKKDDPEAAAGIAARFETALSAHEAILAKLAVNADAAAKASVAELVTKVKTYTTQAITAKTQAQAAAQAKADANTSVAQPTTASTANTGTQASTSVSANGGVGSTTKGSVDLKVKIGN